MICLSTLNKNELSEFAQSVLKGSQAFKGSVAKEVFEINQGIRKRQEEAVQLAKTNQLLQESQEALNLFVSTLKQAVNDVQTGFARVETSIGNLENNFEALQGSVAGIDIFTGAGTGAAGEADRANTLRALSTATGASVDGLLRFNSTLANAREIGLQAFERIKRSAQDGQISAQDVSAGFISQIESSLGSALGPDLKVAVSKAFATLGRPQDRDWETS